MVERMDPLLYQRRHAFKYWLRNNWNAAYSRHQHQNITNEHPKRRMKGTIVMDRFLYTD